MTTEREHEESRRLLKRMRREYETEYSDGRMRLARKAGRHRSGGFHPLVVVGAVFCLLILAAGGWIYIQAASSSAVDPSECAIKGNINGRGDRIYHVPGSQSYEATRIDTNFGERWFCSEQEALDAGWRKPYRPHKAP